MNPEIRNRFNNKIIIEAGKYTDVRKAAEENKYRLAEADLAGADLIGADLRWANLRGANLTGANLRGAKYSIARLLTQVN